MEIINSLELAWEKNLGGSSGIYKIPKKIVLTPALLKQLAISKMTDVRLLSAEFNENPVLFTPHVCLLIDLFSSLEFLGIYTADVSMDKDDSDSITLEDLPSFCIRRAFWTKTEDLNNYQVADDKEQYLLGEKQTLSHIIFLKNEQFSEVSQLISEVFHIFKKGLYLQEEYRDKTPYYEANLKISDGNFRYDFTYNPSLLKSVILEDWIIKWRSCINNLPLDIGYLPDDKFRISYELSLFDKISMFRRIQR